MLEPHTGYQEAVQQKSQRITGAVLHSEKQQADGSLEVYKWAKRICEKAYEAGLSCSYKTIDVHTEFTGSTCAESSVETVTAFMKQNVAPMVNFRTMADIKPSCRKVAMKTRAWPGFVFLLMYGFFKFSYLPCCLCLCVIYIYI